MNLLVNKSEKEMSCSRPKLQQPIKSSIKVLCLRAPDRWKTTSSIVHWFPEKSSPIDQIRFRLVYFFLNESWRINSFLSSRSILNCFLFHEASKFIFDQNISWQSSFILLLITVNQLRKIVHSIRSDKVGKFSSS